MVVLHFIGQVILGAAEILNGASVWLVISFILAGLMHNLMSPDRLQRALGDRSLASLLKATVSGMLLPICSCGVIPLGLGLYYSGAYLGPTLAFMTATPIINPAAVLLAYGLLGPQIATIYLATGFIIPVVIGMIGNWLGGPELCAPGVTLEVEEARFAEVQRTSLATKLVTGLEWGFKDLGMMVSKWVILGMFLAGLISAAVPAGFIQHYLGNPGMISITGIAVLGTVMYVCAVGHIPFIAALVAAGAAPGVAITFLMTGAATNLPELISIGNMIGKRAVAIYTGSMIVFSVAVGWLTNLILLPGFRPFFDLSVGQHNIGLANKIIFSAPEPMRWACSLLIVALFLYAYWPRIKLLLASEGSAA